MRDALVIGAGFGGLGATMALAEAGADVVLVERLKYAGGCASTFSRRGLRWEAGATLMAGFSPGQLFRNWVDQYGLNVGWHDHDPVLTQSIQGTELVVPADRQAWCETLCALPGAPIEGLRRYFDFQKEIAETLWEVLDQPELLPPITPRMLLRHSSRLTAYLPMLRWVGRPLVDLLEYFGVANFAPFRTWVDAGCQITVQVPADRAEALFALSSLDFFFRGVSSVDGGIGEFATALLDTTRSLGVQVELANEVRGLERTRGGWRVHCRNGVHEARTVFANVLPQVLSSWLDAPIEGALQDRLEDGWGAVMLYLAVADRPDLPREPFHRQVVADPAVPLLEANHALISVGGVQELDGEAVRTATVSTHVPMNQGLDASRIEAVQQALQARFAEVFPSLEVRFVMPASPRTFERFTGRPGGLVGGVPRVAGLHNYRSALQGPVRPGLHLVGDSVFPGQSALASAIGGQRAVVSAFGVSRSQRAG